MNEVLKFDGLALQYMALVQINLFKIGGPSV